LDDVGIDYCGRYGEWAYLWTDESFVSGERAVERALTRVPTRGHVRLGPTRSHI
jgi:hypothetical protein